MKRRGHIKKNLNSLQKKNLGGLFGKDENGKVDTQGIQAVGSLGTGLLDAIDSPNADGVRSTAGAGISGAVNGAVGMAALGPPGMVAGAVLGGAASLLGNSKAEQEAEWRKLRRDEKVNELADKEVAAKLAGDPTAAGNYNASMYAKGGTIKGKSAKKFGLKGTTLGKVRPEQIMPSVSIRPNRMLELGGDIEEGVIPIGLEGRAVVKGPSHEEGGVPIPELGIELEGEETLDGDFVFSEELGYAQKHKKIMKAMARTEKDDTPLAAHTREKLAENEEKLKLHQEKTKQAMGVENEIDNTAEEMKHTNKTVPFKDQKGLKKKALGGRATGDEEETPSRGKRLLDGIREAAPFASNIVNTFRRLPDVPEPILTEQVAPQTRSYDASRAEVNRQVRGANLSAEAGLSSSAATRATIAANLTQGLRETNRINEMENNVNADARDRATEQNLQITRENNQKLEYNNVQRVSRQLKQQELAAENLADFGSKIQLQTRDRNLRSLEDDKLMLQIAQDNTGASWRAGKHVFKRRLTPESYQQLDAQMSRMAELDEAQRAELMKALQSGLTSTTSPAASPSVLIQTEKKRPLTNKVTQQPTNRR